MKIYLASSWKNAGQVNALKDILEVCGDGHKVDAFCFPSPDRFVFDYREIPQAPGMNAIEFLQHDKPQQAFREDRKWLDWSDCCIMMLPCGKSAHLEAGYAKGRGKLLYIFGDFAPGEYEVMYGFADAMFHKRQIDDLILTLREQNEKLLQGVR